MIKFYDLSGESYFGQATITRKTSVNGGLSLTGEVFAGDDVLNGLDYGWWLNFDNEKYVITYKKLSDDTNTIVFDAVQQFFWDFAKVALHSQYTGSHTYEFYLGKLFSKSGYTYQNDATVPAFEKENWGYKNKLSLFNDIMDQADVEFEVHNERVHIAKQIGSDLTSFVRKGINLSDLTEEMKISDFATYAKGYGAFKDSEDKSKGRLEVEYRSELSKKFGDLEMDPIVDERYTAADNLIAELKKKIDATYTVSMTMNIYDLENAGYPNYESPKVGDWILAIDEALNFKRKIRIIKLEEQFDATGKRIGYTATCGDLNIIDQYTNIQSSLDSKVQRIQESVDNVAVSANGKNSNYYGAKEPSSADDGDLWFDQSNSDPDKWSIKQWANGRWEQLTLNPGEVEAKVSVAREAADTATKNANTAVENANKAIEDAGFATDTANTAKDVADSAKGDATQAKSDSATALTSAKDAQNNANTALDNAKTAKDVADSTKVDATQAKSDSATALTNSKDAQNNANTALTHANSAIAKAESTAAGFGKVEENASDALSSAMNAQSSASDAVVQATSAAADSKDAKQIAGAVSQNYKTLTDGSTMTIAELENGLATKLTKTDLDGYATQTWTQNQIKVSADGINSTLSSVKGTVDGHTTSINDLKADSSSFKSQFTAVNDTLGKQNTDIGTLQATSKELSSNFSSLNTDNTTNKNDISQLKQTATEVGSTLATVQMQVQNSAVGTNLIVQSDLKNGYINRDNGGVICHKDNFYSDNYIATNGETVFTFSSPDYAFKGATNHTLAMYDSDKNYLGYQTMTSATQTLSKYNVAYIRFSINFKDEGGVSGNLSDWLDNHRYKLEKGSVATDYSVNPEDTATVTALSNVDQKVDSISSTVTNNKSDADSQFTNINQTIGGIQSTVANKADSSTVTQLSNVVDSKVSMKDYNSEITQLADDINLKVSQVDFDNLQIGGRNLIENSQPNNDSGWNFKSNGTVDYKVVDGQYIEITRTGGGYHQINRQYQNDKDGWYSEIKPGDQFAISMDVSMPTIPTLDSLVYGQLRLNAGDTFNSTHINWNLKDIIKNANTWYRVSGVMDIPDNWETDFTKATRARFLIESHSGSDTDVIRIRNIKLEKGNKATGWSPAPDDKADKDNLVSQINIDKSGVLIQGKKIMIDGDTYIKNGVIKSAMIDTLDANKITTGTLNAANVNIINLNANNITTGTLNANLISVRATSSGKSIKMDGNGISGWDANGRLRMKWGIQDLAGDGQSDPSNLILYTGNGNKSFSIGTNVDDTLVIGSEANDLSTLIRSGLRMNLETPDLRIYSHSGDVNYWKINYTDGEPEINSTFPVRGRIGSSSSYIGAMYGYIGNFRQLEVGFGKGAPQEGDFHVGEDGSRARVWSNAIYNRTYSNSPNVHVTGNGTLGRSTSASKYKLDISDVDNLTEKAQVFLAVKPKQWFDKQETQDFADKLMGNDRIQESPTVNPHAGFIAEDLAVAGLNEFISYGADGSLEGIQYDRLTILHHELLRQAYNKIDYLMTQLNIMDKRISKLEGEN